MKTSKTYNPINFPSLNKHQLEEIEKLKKQSDDSINTKDIPEATDMELKTGHFYYSGSLRMPKVSVHLMLDEDNLKWLKSKGKGYQPRLNNILRWAKLNNCPIDEM